MTGVRERARAELTVEIKAIARRQMAVDGPANLSLRAVARELGMVSSAIYRYFPSRDLLLTALIVDAYNELGELAEVTDASIESRDVLERWNALGWATYRWAVDAPSQYSLLFGTPVPGYRAPDDTIGPATRYTSVLARLLDDVASAGGGPVVAPTVPAVLAPDVERLRQLTGTSMDDATFLAGMQAWTAMFGLISFVLFGQLHNVVDDHDDFVRMSIDLIGRQVVGQQHVRQQGTGRRRRAVQTA